MTHTEPAKKFHLLDHLGYILLIAWLGLFAFMCCYHSTPSPWLEPPRFPPQGQGPIIDSGNSRVPFSDKVIPAPEPTTLEKFEGWMADHRLWK